MEIRKDGYKYSVEAVAKELMGPEYIDRLASGKLKLRDYQWEGIFKPWVRTYLPLLRTGLDQKHVSGRDEVSFAHNALATMTSQINKGIWNSTEGVSWTVASAILNKEPALAVEGIHQVYVRYLFDLAFGLVVSDFRERYEGARRNYKYGVLQVRNGKDWAEIWQSNAEYYSAFQHKLREPLVAVKSQQKSRLLVASA